MRSSSQFASAGGVGATVGDGAGLTVGEVVGDPVGTMIGVAGGVAAVEIAGKVGAFVLEPGLEVAWSSGATMHPVAISAIAEATSVLRR